MFRGLGDATTTHTGTRSAVSGTNATWSLPPLPEPPIFDAPYNPFVAGLLNTTALIEAKNLTAAEARHVQEAAIEAIVDGARRSARSLTLTLMLSFLLLGVVSLLLLIQIRRHRHLALKGDLEAAKKIILPAFEPLLWLLCSVSVAFLLLYGAVLMTDKFTVYVSKASIEIMYAGKQFLFLVVPVFMLQASLSTRALCRSVVITVLLSAYTVPIVWVLQDYGSRDRERLYYWIVTLSRLVLLVPLGYVLIHPPARASSQTLREYCFFVISIIVLVFATGETFHENRVQLATTLNWIVTVYSLLLPIFIWRVLRADTEHWRGIGQRAVELQALFRRKTGRVDERVSAQGLHVFIEMHRKLIVDFAHLAFQEQIATGETTATYRGFLHTKKIPVAIKIYMPVAFTEETVAEFSHEAALCGSLQHPNVVKFHGLCVCPPNICLLTELCPSSLREAIREQATRVGPRSVHRQQFLLNLGYVLDAARAVAYLHSFSPPFVHRDIKPSNFLVGEDGMVKLTDFGASRTLTLRSTSGHQGHEHEAKGDVKSKAPRATVAEIPGVSLSQTPNETPSEYMAPEVIRNNHAGTRIYGEAADVYALAMTMWDVFHPTSDKYPLAMASRLRERDHGHRQSVVFEQVFAGQRPRLDPALHGGIGELIERGWHADARQRPSARGLVKALERIQEEVSSTPASELMGTLSRHARNGTAVFFETESNYESAAATRTQFTFAGSHAVEMLRMGEMVETEAEAVRLGSMLMDAGFLHHAKHTRSFEYSSAQYFFDEEHIQLCQPVAMMEEDGEGTSDGPEEASPARVFAHKQQQLQRRWEERSASSSFRGDASAHGSHALLEHASRSRCACRRLGQRIETEFSARRRLRQRFKATADEHLVTATLLADDPPPATFRALDDAPPTGRAA